MFWRLKLTRLLIYFIIATWVYVINIYLLYEYYLKHTLTYDVLTPTCKIPHLNPFDSEVMKYTKLEEIPCKHTDRIIMSNDTHLMINPEYIDYFKTHKINCSYRAFWREIPQPEEADNKYTFEKTEHVFKKTIRVTDEFVKIECNININGNYTDYHAFVPVSNVDTKNRMESSYSDKLNVIIIGIASVPRHHFHRQMPKTLDYLVKDLEAIEYLGYHKVGGNSFENLIPVFTGQNIEELKKSCWYGMLHRFDECNFIWKQYENKGYVTAYIEEEGRMGTFNYFRGGFTHQPTTHYWAPFSYLAEKDIGRFRICWGPKLTVLNLLGYAMKFVRSYLAAKKHFFATFWESSITQGMIKFYPEFDETYKKFLKTLNRTGILNNSIMFVISDDGFQHGNILKTNQGQIEAKLPLFYIKVPHWFKGKYPYLMKNLKKNAKKLTSHFDLYETLNAIVDEEYSYRLNFKKTKGISLFQEIPEDRTCKDAGIPVQFCTCQTRMKVNVDNTPARVAEFVITQINKLFIDYKYCAKLHLNKIIDARILIKDNTETDNVNLYTVVFQTSPGHGIFECTVECRNCEKDFKLMSTIMRNNLVGNESYCVDGELKLYCFCTK